MQVAINYTKTPWIKTRHLHQLPTVVRPQPITGSIGKKIARKFYHRVMVPWFDGSVKYDFPMPCRADYKYNQGKHNKVDHNVEPRVKNAPRKQEQLSKQQVIDLMMDEEPYEKCCSDLVDFEWKALVYGAAKYSDR